jgi:Protein of unknown function (DUF732)
VGVGLAGVGAVAVDHDLRQHTHLSRSHAAQFMVAAVHAYCPQFSNQLP